MTAQTMTERFEIRLSQDVLNRVDDWRSRQEDLPSRSEAARRLMEAGLAAKDPERKVKLDDGSKLVILMLGELFKQLKLKTQIDPDFLAEVIYGGHYWALDWEYSGIFHHHEDGAATVSEVVDVMDMWTFLEEGFERLSKEDQDRVAEATTLGKYVVFSGFDGNNESSHVHVAQFLVDKLGRFTRFHGRELNSHMPTLDAYRRMLVVFSPIRNTLIGRGLTSSEIIAIMDAAVHPSQRVLPKSKEPDTSR